MNNCVIVQQQSASNDRWTPLLLFKQTNEQDLAIWQTITLIIGVARFRHLIDNEILQYKKTFADQFTEWCCVIGFKNKSLNTLWQANDELNDHTTTTNRHSALAEIDKMILLDPEVFGPSIAKFHVTSIRGNSQRLLLSYKSWMLIVMSFVAVLIRMPEAYAVNVTVKSTLVSMSSYHATEVLPMGDIVSLLKGKKPIVIPENEVITSEDTEDYLEEDSEEDYDSDVKKENASGELNAFKRFMSSLPLFIVIIILTWIVTPNAGNGLVVGGRCEFTCDKRLHHVFCNPISNKCECEKNYPVKIGRSSGSLKLLEWFSWRSLFCYMQFATLQDPAKAVRNVSVYRTQICQQTFYLSSLCLQPKNSATSAFTT